MTSRARMRAAWVIGIIVIGGTSGGLLDAALLGVAPAQAQERVDRLTLGGVGEPRSGRLARDATDTWRLQANAGDFVDIVLEPSGLTINDSAEWPQVTVTAPDGTRAFETGGPTFTLSVDAGSRMMVAFVAATAGEFTLHVTARRQIAERLPYTLLVRRHAPVEARDRSRLMAYQIGREALHLYSSGTREARQAALQKLEGLRSLHEDLAPGDEDRPVVLTTMAAVHYALGDAAPGQRLARQAVEQWRALGRPREEALALSDVGVFAFLAYQHADARRYYEQALAVHRLAGDREGQAVTLVRLGWVDFAAGDMARVIELNREALPLWQEVGNHGGESVSHNDLGRAWLELGEVSQALEEYEASLAMRNADIDPRGAAVVLMRIGQLYLNVADWQPAFDALQRALALSRRAHDSRNEASILSNLGLACSRVGDSEQALRYLEAALALAQASGNRTVEGNSLAGLGAEAYVRGDLEQSRALFERALAVQTTIKDMRGQAATLRYLASTLLALGRPHEALARINESLGRTSAAGDSPAGLATLASTHAALGDAAEADRHYARAVERARQIRARDQEASVLTLHGRFLASQGRHAEARERLAEAVNIHESLRAGLADIDQRMHYASRALAPYTADIEVLVALDRQQPARGFAEEAFEVAERARARGLLDLLALSNTDLTQGVDAALVARERALRWRLNARAAIQTTLLMDKGDTRRLARIEREIAELTQSWRETVTALRQASPAYTALAAPQPLSVTEIQALLDARTVLLEYIPGDAHGWLFAVTRTSFSIHELEAQATIDEAARQLHRLITGRQPVAGELPATRQARIARADRQLGAQLRAVSRLVLSPIATSLAGDWRGRRLVVVAGGALEYVPFATLPVPDGVGVPLVERHELVMLPSASTLPYLRRDGATPARAGLLAVLADPVFSSDDPRVAPAVHPLPTADARGTPRAPDSTAPGGRATLTRLPFSRAEALALAQLAPATARLQATDFDASLELATSGRLGGYRIVHLATHGIIDTRRPELSGLALSLVDRQGRTHDGFLRLNTIYNLRLSAELVVLSACQTALGKEVTGEGLIGLTRGFMHAGARRVVASLWQVNDVATAELMKRFYAALLQKRLPAAAALREAQRGLAADPRWASPYYWGGFVIQGDWQ